LFTLTTTERNKLTTNDKNMNTQNEVAKLIEQESTVASTSVWNDRIYVNVVGHDRTFRGCGTHKIWINKDGVVIFESGKGTMPTLFNNNFHALKEKFSK